MSKNVLDIRKSIGTATCRICKNLIPKGEDEVVGNLGTGNYPGCYHLKCFIEHHYTFIHELYNKLSDAEREDLDRSN